MKVRLVSSGWENFTGSLGFQAVFKEGVSVEDMTPRQIARIGSSLQIVDVETGEQVGPSAVLARTRFDAAEVAVPMITKTQEDAEIEVSRKRLATEAAERKAADAQALLEAQQKAAAAVDELVIYSRTELEAIGANNGIQGLREIATPLGIKGRGISELVNEILKAQAQKAAA